MSNTRPPNSKASTTQSNKNVQTSRLEQGMGYVNGLLGIVGLIGLGVGSFRFFSKIQPERTYRAGSNFSSHHSAYPSSSYSYGSSSRSAYTNGRGPFQYSNNANSSEEMEQTINKFKINETYRNADRSFNFPRPGTQRLQQNYSPWGQESFNHNKSEHFTHTPVNPIDEKELKARKALGLKTIGPLNTKEIKTAFKALALKTHPDTLANYNANQIDNNNSNNNNNNNNNKNFENSAEFREVLEAYNLLMSKTSPSDP